MVCKTFIAGSIPAVASVSRKSRDSETAEQRSYRLLSDRWFTLPKTFRSRGIGLRSKDKGLQGIGLRRSHRTLDRDSGYLYPCGRCVERVSRHAAKPCLVL